MIRSSIFSDLDTDWNTILDSMIFAIICTMSGFIIYYGGSLSGFNILSILSALVAITFRTGHIWKLFRLLMFNRYTKKLFLTIYNTRLAKYLISRVYHLLISYYVSGIWTADDKLSQPDVQKPKVSSCSSIEYPSFLMLDIEKVGKFIIPRLQHPESDRMRIFKIVLISDDDNILDISMSYPYNLQSAKSMGGKKIEVYSDEDEIIQTFYDDDIPDLGDILSSDMLESI